MTLRPLSAGVEITVRVQPRASRSGIVGPHGDALKVRVAAPPVEGAANRELVRLLAKALGVPRGAVAIVKGEGSRTKVLRVEGVTAPEARERLGL